MTVKEYITSVEKLTWENSLDLFELMKHIPQFEDPAGVAFEIIKFGNRRKLKALGIVANSLREINTIAASKFGINPNYVIAQNFSYFAVIIETNEAALFF